MKYRQQVTSTSRLEHHHVSLLLSACWVVKRPCSTTMLVAATGYSSMVTWMAVSTWVPLARPCRWRFQMTKPSCSWLSATRLRRSASQDQHTHARACSASSPLHPHPYGLKWVPILWPATWDMGWDTLCHSLYRGPIVFWPWARPTPTHRLGTLESCSGTAAPGRLGAVTFQALRRACCLVGPCRCLVMATFWPWALLASASTRATYGCTCGTALRGFSAVRTLWAMLHSMTLAHPCLCPRMAIALQWVRQTAATRSAFRACSSGMRLHWTGYSWPTISLAQAATPNWANRFHCPQTDRLWPSPLPMTATVSPTCLM